MFSDNLARYVTIKIILVANFLIIVTDTVKIEDLIVPEVVQSGSSTSAILDCRYSGVGNQFTVQWLFNGSETPVYQWSPPAEPQVTGILERHLDLTYKASPLPNEERRALRIQALEPLLSGHYTCRIFDHVGETRQTKTMLVFSPEKDFLLEFFKHNSSVEIKCTARGIYPQPELILEHNSMMFAKQEQRMWRNEDLLFDVESTAHMSIPASGLVKMEKITCRLHLHQAGYSAIKKELLHIGKGYSNSSEARVSMWPLVLFSILYYF